MRQPGYFGRFGGTWVPEILMPALEELEAAFLDAQRDRVFNEELALLLRDFAGRPTPLYRCARLGIENQPASPSDVGDAPTRVRHRQSASSTQRDVFGDGHRRHVGKMLMNHPDAGFDGLGG